MLDLHKLHAFVVVIEERNITHAANRLFIQQPPLTRLLKKLEEELGTQLLIRQPRGIERLVGKPLQRSLADHPAWNATRDDRRYLGRRSLQAYGGRPSLRRLCRICQAGLANLPGSL